MKKVSKISLKKIIFGSFFAILSVLGLVAPIMGAEVAMAVPEQVNVDENTEVETEPVVEEPQASQEPAATVSSESCESSLGPLSWLACPSTGKIAEAVDWLYEKIEDILVINPVSMKDDSPVYQIWRYFLGVTNIVFIIFLLVAVYSQITGMGISNYGIKKALPKLIVAAILVNLSFLICSLAVDLSNVIGSSLRGIFTSIEESTLANAVITEDAQISMKVSMAEMYSSMAGGTALAIGAGAIGFESGAIWMLIPVALGAIVSVATGLITIALRQAVVVLLIMIAPLAMVAYILPNTDKWFKKWKELFFKMLVFYPMFSLLFGASSLAGWAIISSAKDGFWLILGVAVQIFPLFFSWSLMKMSDTFLGKINARMHGIAAGPLARNRAWAESRREATKQRYLASPKAYTPTLRLRQYLSDRKIARDEETKERAEYVKNRGLAYNAKKNYKKNGTPSREGELAYEMQARNMSYQRDILRHKNNMNKGMGQLETLKQNGTVAQKARLEKLDNLTVREADLLKAEQARAEKIDYDNAKGYHKRMEEAMNAHFDLVNAGRNEYKIHRDISDRVGALSRYNMMRDLMEGSLADTQYVAAAAAQAYDTQAKILTTKYQKYFELTPPTKDVEYRLGELTKLRLENLKNGVKAVDYIDAIIPGLRILNQRGDTDLVKEQLDNLLDKEVGGGVKLGTHASQALASFLMFEVKDNDPALRRFGKYINLETANAFNKNNRKVMDVTYDEYLRGYHDGEPDLVSEQNQTGRMYAKKDAKKLIEGTSLDNIERTALSNLDESLKKAYGYKKGAKGKDWDVDGYLKKREEIQTAFEPAFLSSSLKWLSGSEQINSAVKFWTGYEQRQKKDTNGNIVTDDNGDPIYELSPVWEGEEFAGEDDEVKKKVQKYYRRKTMDYFKDQTTGQILGMRTDYRDSTKEHLIAAYLNDNSGKESSAERKKRYKAEMDAILARKYEGKTPKEAEDLRNKDIKALNTRVASKQIRKILGDTGKLEQIYRTRRSGAANNAKDWLREWVGLDDEEEMYREVEFYEKKRKEKQALEEASTDNNPSGDDKIRIYDAAKRAEIRDGLEKIWEDNKDVSASDFYDVAIEAIEGWFGGKTSLIEYEFRKFYEMHEHDSGFEAYTLKDKLENLLHQEDKYPDA